MKLQDIIVLGSLLILLMIILIILIVISTKRENYDNILARNITCAYALNGSDFTKCNDWIKNYRDNKLCDSYNNEICCEKALDCCNLVASCGNGKNCMDPKYKPTKTNSLFYDKNYINIS